MGAFLPKALVFFAPFPLFPFFFSPFPFFFAENRFFLKKIFLTDGK